MKKVNVFIAMMKHTLPVAILDSHVELVNACSDWSRFKIMVNFGLWLGLWITLTFTVG